jgi:hypothetical protein
MSFRTRSSRANQAKRCGSACGHVAGSSCGAVKHERFILLDGRIRKVSQSTDYPDGYLLSGTGVPRGVKRSEVVWSENYRRAMESVAEKVNGKARVRAPRGKTTKVKGRR